MVPVVSFVGNSNTGKTTLIEKVVPELKKLGYRVAVVKHAHHGFEMDQPGKDSWRFAQAGSDLVVIASPQKIVLIEQTDKELYLDKLIPRISDKVDVILTEGYKGYQHPDSVKVEATGSENIAEIVDLISARVKERHAVGRN
jgi:molybdopterin-guanine dinucleotide biosynthesis adapter protein